MATLTRAYSEVDGAIGEASSINRVIDDLYSTINSLNSANLVSGSINTNELADSAVTTLKLDECAVTTAKIAESARGVSLAEGLLFYTEFF